MGGISSISGTGGHNSKLKTQNEEEKGDLSAKQKGPPLFQKDINSVKRKPYEIATAFEGTPRRADLEKILGWQPQGVEATSLLTEDANDGKVSCLDMAADWVNRASPEIRSRSEMVFLKDQRPGAEGQTGHVVIKQGEKIFDPTSGKSYDSMDAYRKEHPHYQEAGRISANAAKRVLDTPAGTTERAEALEKARVSPELQKMMVADPVGELPDPINTKSREVKVPYQQGPVTVEFNDKIDKNVKKENGYTTVTIEAETGLSASGSLEAKKLRIGGTKLPLEASGGVSTGKKMTYELKLTDADYERLKRGELKPPNPLDPSTLPDNASMTISRSQAKGWSAGVSGNFREVHVGAGQSYSESTGTSFEVSRKGNKISITEGPTAEIEAGLSISAGVGPVSVSLSGTTSLKESHFKKAEFDISSKEGKKAFDAFRQSGRLPQKEGPGVSNTVAIDKFSAESQAKIGLNLGGHEWSKALNPKSGFERTLVTHPDGTKTLTMTGELRADRPKLSMKVDFDKNGKTVPGSEQYNLLFDTKDDNARRQLVMAFTKDPQAAQRAAASDKPLTLTLTEKDLLQLRQKSEQNGGERTYFSNSSPYQAVLTLASHPIHDQYQITDNLHKLYWQRNPPQKLPGTVTGY
ncbi:hypothetical protein F0U61_53105 [Archangium violaceum]|uniref:hypothetical protein n=1 Tax=Archangium violaceum TaxID=83451 RepID=UPI002B2CE064|nr:hypothetical protein F0U61_53105 [Archangium violaceum]